MGKNLKQFKVSVRLKETYERTFIVPAKSAKAARERAIREWEENDYMYDKVIDCVAEQRSTSFINKGELSEKENMQEFGPCLKKDNNQIRIFY